MMIRAKWNFGVWIGLLLLGVLSAGCAGSRTAFKPTRPYVDGEVIVQFKNGPESWEAREANAAMGGTVLKVLKDLKIALIQLPPGMDTIKGVEQYRRHPAVATAEPNYVISPLKNPTGKN